MRTPSTWNGTYRELSALYTYAQEREWIQTNPFDKLKNKRVEEREIIPLHSKQLRALLRACRPPPNEEEKAHAAHMRKLIGNAMKPNATVQDKKAAPRANQYELKLANADTSELALYIALMAFAGVRPEEGKRLTWSDISLEDNVSIRARKSKTGGARHIKIRPCLRAWILAATPERHRPDDPVVPPENLKFKMAARRRRAGFGASAPPPGKQMPCGRPSPAWPSTPGKRSKKYRPIWATPPPNSWPAAT